MEIKRPDLKLLETMGCIWIVNEKKYIINLFLTTFVGAVVRVQMKVIKNEKKH